MADDHGEETRFYAPDEATVETLDDIERLTSQDAGVLVRGLTDERLFQLASRAPHLRRIFTDGCNDVTDAGLVALQGFHQLERLDLEWSGVTDAGLPVLAAVSTLRWVDLGFCEGVSSQGVDALQQRRPDLEIVNWDG